MADTPPPSGAQVDFVRVIGPYVPGAAGALLGMAFASNLTVRGRLLALAAGVASALWVSPAARTTRPTTMAAAAADNHAIMMHLLRGSCPP